LSRAGQRVFALPLYSTTPLLASAWDAGQANGQLAHTPAGTFYYRSSLCATNEGRAACAALERGVRLDVIEEREVPAIASQPWLPLGDRPVVVGLYRIGSR
jgi:hypothetical protein